MNLIEQLGWYERAKEGLHRLKLEKKDLLTCGDLVVVESELDAALLEYRRQHNIFEVGDFVLRNDGLGNVLKVTSIEGEYANLVRRVDGESIWSWFKLVDIRHATDEEIKAGKRLDAL